jgi:predicted phosphodiesterase
MTAYAVISDVHANLEALETVLEEIEKEEVDQILFLGDAVGYGPNPNECVELLRRKSAVMIAGNHDRAAAGMDSYDQFNLYAKTAIEWTMKSLSKENLRFLQGLSLTEAIEKDDIFLVHGTPKEPEMWHYLISEYTAALNLAYFEEKICFVGHSHQPFIIESSYRDIISTHYNSRQLRNESRYIVNAGSVGQPRDGNPDASYIVFRKDRLQIKRVPYDIVLTQNKMEKAGLPAYLIERLAAGR